MTKLCFVLFILLWLAALLYLRLKYPLVRPPMTKLSPEPKLRYVLFILIWLAALFYLRFKYPLVRPPAPVPELESPIAK